MQNGSDHAADEHHSLPVNGTSVTADVGEVVRRLCPVLQMHHQETCFPCSAEWFVERSELRYLPLGNEHPDQFELIAAEGQVTGEVLREAPKNPKVSIASNLALHIPDRFTGGVPVAQLNDVPMYAHIKRVVSPGTNHVVALEINYMALYAWNGSYPIFGVPCGQAGSHPGDWEHLTVRTSPTGQPLALWYNAHRNIDGSWLPWSAVPVTSCGRPIAYVAKHGHGVYPTAGLQARALLAVNDHTSDKGPLWAPNKVVLFQNPDAIRGAAQATNEGTSYQLFKAPRDLADRKKRQEAAVKGGGGTLPELVLDTDSAWSSFPGRWGGVSAPARQRWFKSCEPVMSRTKLQRILQCVKPTPIPETLKKQTVLDATTKVSNMVDAAVNVVT